VELLLFSHWPAIQKQLSLEQQRQMHRLKNNSGVHLFERHYLVFGEYWRGTQITTPVHKYLYSLTTVVIHVTRVVSRVVQSFSASSASVAVSGTLDCDIAVGQICSKHHRLCTKIKA
jgi:hypothetical protein